MVVGVSRIRRVILDFGFDAINPLLEQAKLGEHL
jgi:hypothetical protein